MQFATYFENVPLRKSSESLKAFYMNISTLLANGTSYFGGYVEKVTVGSQTDNDKDKEHLEDMVTAFQMQNKFLNKVRFIK